MKKHYVYEIGKMHDILLDVFVKGGIIPVGIGNWKLEKIENFKRLRNKFDNGMRGFWVCENDTLPKILSVRHRLIGIIDCFGLGF